MPALHYATSTLKMNYAIFLDLDKQWLQVAQHGRAGASRLEHTSHAARRLTRR